MLEPGDVDAFEASIKKADFLLLNNEVPAAQSAERMQAGGSRFPASKILMKTGAYT